MLIEALVALTQCQVLGTIIDVLPINTDKGELHLVSQLYGIVAVLKLLHVPAHLLE